MGFAKYSVIVLFAFIFAGCSQHSFLSLTQQSSDQHDTDIQENVTSDEGDLELSESEICLDAELVALSQTGGWNRPEPSTSDQASVGVHYDFPIVINKQVQMYLQLFQHSQRKQFARWLSRSTAYLPMIRAQLDSAGLPQDLAYLAMIESGFNAKALSRAKAVGMWQFMRGTGKQYNLTIDKYVDERRDPEKATIAAVDYLSDLYKEFNDWHLAVAAYNGGPGKIRSGLKRHKTDNFWDLASQRHLSMETKRYVPKLIAALLIAKEPEKYGFTNINYAKPLDYESLSVGPGMSLKAIALISHCSIKEIKRLNQELRQDITPLNVTEYDVKIPRNSIALAEKNISRLHNIVHTAYKTHKIAKGDTLSKICATYNVNKTTLLKVNNLHAGKLPVGQNLRIPYNTVSYQLLPEGSPGALAAFKDSLVLHKIRKGDTISKIARQYNVPANMIVSWNGLKSVHSIRAGQQLALFIDKGTRSETANGNSLSSNSKVPRLVAEQRKEYIQQAENSFVWYDVQNGDSLWTISRKFSASTSDLKKWNNLKTNLIHPGSKLKLKKG